MTDPIIARLIERLSHTDYATRKRATEQLAERGESAVPALLEALQQSSALVRVRAAEALGRIGSPTAIPALSSLLIVLQDETLLVEVVGALDRIRKAHTEASVRESVELAFAAYDREIERYGQNNSRRPDVLRSTDLLIHFQDQVSLAERTVPPSQATAGGTYQRAIPRDIDALVARLADANFATGKTVVERLVEQGAAAVEPLISTPLSRLAVQRAAQVLGRIGDPRATNFLVTHYRQAFSESGDLDLISALQEGLTALATHIAEQPTNDQLPALVTLVRELRVSLPRAAVIAARGLKSLAETGPTPALRQAIPALKGSLFHPVPLEFGPIRKEIEQATAAWKDLPLAATAPALVSGLPRPATGADDDA